MQQSAALNNSLLPPRPIPPNGPLVPELYPDNGYQQPAPFPAAGDFDDFLDGFDEIYNVRALERSGLRCGACSVVAQSLCVWHVGVRMRCVRQMCGVGVILRERLQHRQGWTRMCIVCMRVLQPHRGRGLRAW